jgi:hypothetical protein
MTTEPYRSALNDRWFAALIFAGLALKLALFPFAAHSPLAGDEGAYVDGARALSSLIRDLVEFKAPDVTEVQSNAVGSGWFMPGMSIMLTPLFLVDPDASIAVIRGYLGLLTTAVFLRVVLFIRHCLGRSAAMAVLVFPGLVPMWALFSFGSWADLMAGVCLLFLIGSSMQLIRTIQMGDAPTLRQATACGVGAVAATYFRSSALLTVAVLGCFVLMLGLAAGRTWLPVLRVAVTAGLVYGALLVPWSVLAAQTLGTTVVTTTSVANAQSVTFGDPDRVCFGPCDPGSTRWFNPLRYSREVARATGESEVEIQREMSTYARSELTPQNYALTVGANFGHYFGAPGAFVENLLIDKPGASPPAWSETFVIKLTEFLFLGAFAVACLSLVLRVRGPVQDQALAMLVKLSLLTLLTQPFVHVAGSRYWTTAAPLVGLVVLPTLRGLATESARAITSRKQRPVAGLATEPSTTVRLVRLMTLMDWLVIVMVFVVVGGLIALAAGLST